MKTNPTKRISKHGRDFWTCCLCSKIFEGWGNNPAPLSDREDDDCCNECNMLVMKARFEMMGVG